MSTERSRLDQTLSAFIEAADRAEIWQSVDSILGGHSKGAPKCTLALGYVQSGKTTSMAALTASAADSGYRIVVALLGSTLLLRDQNRDRLEDLLGIRLANYQWISLDSIKGASSSKELNEWLQKGRTIFLPVLKHAGHITKVANAIKKVASDLPILIIDDEADQASLNTRPTKPTPSSTYSAICNLRDSHPNHLYVQYTATPYAPLLLPPDDPLMPTSVEFLKPGAGYTGGREFLITHAKHVIRTIPHSDESGRAPISDLPQSLIIGFAAFVAGAACLWSKDRGTAPISMLIHPTHRTDAQDRYHFLLRRFISRVRESTEAKSKFHDLVTTEYERILAAGGHSIPIDVLLEGVDVVLEQAVLWLVNSASDVNKINWNYSPFHVLIGGNKLDRGFTVEGLTVSYMNRKASEQVDTTEQRARAFGYRREFLPYCQIHAGARTIRLLRGIVHTEDDLRANLRDWLDSGGSINDWARKIGLDLPAGTSPSRRNVLPALANFNPDGDWHVLRRPCMDIPARRHNLEVVRRLGLFDGQVASFGRIGHRTMLLTPTEIVSQILDPWIVDEETPGWRHEEIINHLERHPLQDQRFGVFLLCREDASTVLPRERKWADDTGFINLFQGRDLASRTSDRYEGDRTVRTASRNEEAISLQIHFVKRTGVEEPGFPTLAIHLGDRQVVRTIDKGGLA